jgi:hypothetical protein
MLVEDTTAFIEQLEVQRDDRRARKRNRRRVQAEVELLRVEWERRLAAQVLEKLEEELASLTAPVSAGPGRRLLVARRRRALEHRIDSMRARMRAKEAEALEARERGRRAGRAAPSDRPPRAARVFRLHSERHHLECSAKRFAHLASSQADLPVLVGRKEGRSWWWFLDRFWWDEDGLDARDVKVIVLDLELQRKEEAERLARVREAVLGEEQGRAADRPVSQIVRFAVWCRDRGRCVDCGTAEDVGFDDILPPARGGSRSTRNIELRCVRCRERRAHNQERARVSRARVAALFDV